MEIASPFVSPAVEIIINKMISYVERQRNRRKDFEAGLYKLKMSLLKFKNVVDSTEMTKLTPLQKQILSELKKAVYEADDFLDELDYDNLEKEAKKQTEKRSSLSRKAGSARKFGKRLIGKDEMHNKLDEILKKLDLVKDLATGNTSVVGQSSAETTKKDDIPDNRLTSSHIDEKKIFGRDDQKEDLVRILTESSHEPKKGEKKNIIALVGQGGIGKTTLAQHVYNDERIKDHFDLTIWVCVSTSSDKVSLIKQILERASGTAETHKDITNFDMLVNRLQENLKSRSLMNLKMRGTGESLLAPLQVGDSSSKIVVTTREIRTTKALKATDPIDVKGLKDDDCWSLLRSCAFGDLNPTDQPELEAVGKKIATKLKGSPLAAQVVGGMLRSKLEFSYWKDILQNDVFDDIIKTLKLSYDNLPKHLKSCFSSCAVFPQDWKFDPDDLVALWIAQGYVQTQDDEPTGVISTGKRYFDNLVSRSFFQPTEDDDYLTRYVMHDLIYDLAQTVSGGECLLIQSTELKKTPYHLGVLSNRKDDNLVMKQLKESRKLQDLRTFIYFGNYDRRIETLTLTDVLNGLKSVRAIVIYECEFSSKEVEDLMKSLANKKHLRYLSLPGEWASIPPLYHLQTVCMDEGSSRMLSGRMLSEGLAHLKRFGNLIVCKGKFVFDVEREFQQRFDIFQRDSFVVCGMKKFVDVLHGGLQIQNLQNLYNKEEALELGLGLVQHITGLKLEWNLAEDSMSNSIIFEDVIDGLQPHPNLRVLYIKNYGGIRLPSWLEKNQFDVENNGSIRFPRLEGLVFKNMPNLSKLNGEDWDKLYPCLEDLIIRRCPNLIEVSLQNHRSFPRLKRMAFENMPKLSKLNWDKLFPCLEGLAIIECPNLIDVHFQNLLLLPKLAVLNVKNAVNSPSFTLEITKNTKDLWSIFIGNYESRENVAGQDLSVLSFFQELISASCESVPNLRFRKGGSENSDQRSNCIDLPSSFALEFQNCYSEDAWFWRCLEGLPSRKQLYIRQFEFLTSDIAGLGERDYCNRIPCAELDSLKIIDSNLTDRSLSECLLNVANVSEMNLYRCDNLTSLPPAEVLHRLTALRKLEIYRCEQLISLGGLNALVNLQEMAIYGCPKLESLPDEGLPASVKSLTIVDCHPQLMQQVKEKTGPQWNKISHIPNIDTDYRDL